VEAATGSDRPDLAEYRCDPREPTSIRPFSTSTSDEAGYATPGVMIVFTPRPAVAWANAS